MVRTTKYKEIFRNNPVNVGITVNVSNFTNQSKTNQSVYYTFESRRVGTVLRYTIQIEQK